MKGNSVSSDSFPLQIHWADQFVQESERCIDQEDALTVARTVLFYAGLQLEIMLPPSMSPIQMEAPANDWMLAPEEEIVRASLEHQPAVYCRLLQLSLYTIRLHEEACSLPQEQMTELRSQAGPYIRYVRGQLNRLAGTWFH